MHVFECATPITSDKSRQNVIATDPDNGVHLI